MTQARRPDGSGGPLAKDERIDDIQFYISANAELRIDDIVLYEAALPNETELFPKRFLFTGWFDTGKQGVEWPGDFEIVNHQPPQTWKAAKSILNAKTGQPWIRLSLRGPRPLSDRVRLRFRYWLQGQGTIALTLANSQSGQHWESSVMTPTLASWAQATTDFKIDQAGTFADELRFLLAQGAELLIDDVLLYEPGSSESAKPNRVF